MSEEIMFHGVDLDWMQAQWRDCADKAKQLEIFCDMVGPKVTVQEILEAVGEPEYCGPEIVELKSGRFAPEEDETIIRMFRAGATCPEIGVALNRNGAAITNRIFNLRKKGVRIERERADEEVHAAPMTDALDPGAGITVNGAMTVIESALGGLRQREKKLFDELEKVHAEINEYRRRLSELLAMAGGGLTDGKDQI